MTMHVGHVALRVTDLERSADHVKRVLGLHETGRSKDQLLLSSNEKHHELQLIAGDAAGLDHIGLEVESERELEDIRTRATSAGARILADSAGEEGLGRAIRFVGPADMVYEVYDGMRREALSIHSSLKPLTRKLGHLTFFCADPEAVVAFWRDGLGMRVSDEAGGLTWMRCDSDHHGLAVGPRPEGNVLHHYAWEVQDWGALGQHCDDIARQGMTLLWGPLRHGPGFNLATYLADPDGAVIEVYTDLMQIRDERAYQPVDWSDEPRHLNLWGPLPSEELLTAGVPVLGPRAELSPMAADGVRAEA